MLKSLRSSAGKPAYFHGGQAEEIFQSQLDEVLISDLAKATGDSFSSDLFKQQFPNHVDQTSAGQKPDLQQPPSNQPTPPGNAQPPNGTFNADA